MKRSLLYLSFLAGVSWIVFSSSSGGRAAAASADNTTAGCSCHGFSNGNYNPSITAELLDGASPVTEYTPGNSYTWSVTVTNGTGSPSGFGMQSKALMGSSQAGDFTSAITSNSQLSTLGSIEYAEHNGINSAGVFQYSWTAPTSGSGDVVFYIAGLAANGTGNTASDEAATPITLTVTEAAAAVCNDPTNLTVTNVSATTADVSWTTGGSTIWETEVVLNGAGTSGSGVETMTNPVTVTDLTPGTSYDVYVRDNCSSSLMISGAFDGPLPGGQPKGVELYAANDIADLSVYGFGSANNGGGTDGVEYTFPSISVTAGSYLYLVDDSTGFADYFGFAPDFEHSVANVNGDDALELFLDGNLVDLYGDQNVDGNGETWEYLDGWSYRDNGETNNFGTFDDTKWTYSGANALDPCSGTNNAGCASSMPIGTFSTTVTNSNWVGPETFTTPCTTITLNETVNDISCNGNADGNISLAPSGGGTAYTYSWTGGATTSSVSGLVAGAYDVTVYFGGCSVTDSYTITEPTPLSLSVSTTNITCNGLSDGSAAVTASGGTLPYSYAWGTGSTTSSISGCPAGAITDVTVTDAAGCSQVVGNISVSQPPAITITNTLNTSVSCNGICDGAATMTVAGGTTPYVYMWNGGQSTLAVTGLCGGSVDMSITDGNGCPANLAITIAEPAAIGAVVTVTDATSSGASDGTATVNVTGALSDYTFMWNNGGTDQMATGFAAGTATVTVTEIAGNNCSDIASGVIADPTSCNITLTTAGGNAGCNGGTDGSVTVTAVGGPSTLYSYSWSTGASTASVTGLGAGSYGITVNSGSCSATDAITLTEPAAITGTDAIDLCSGDSVLLGGVYVSTAGAYMDTQAATNGCDSLVSVTVTVILGPEAGAGGVMDVCESDLTADLFDGLTGVTDSSGSWSGVLFGSTIFPIATGVDTSDYTYTVDDGNATACSVDSATVTVIIHASPNAGGSTTTSACSSAGTINLADELTDPEAGGVWNDLSGSGALTDSIFDVNAVAIGDYTVAYSVGGNLGCGPDTAFITVQVVSNPDAGTGGTLEACDDDFLQTLDPADGLGGTPDAGGNWTDDDGSGAFFFGVFSPSTAGPGDWGFTYTVSAAGCADASATVTITVNGAPDAGGDGTDTVCFNETSVDLTTLLSGTPDAGGTWSDDNSSGALTGSVFDPSSAGIGVYNFTYTLAGEGSCVDASASVGVTVEICGGIESVEDNRNAEIFPNPNSGSFIMNLTNWDLTDANVTITTIEGRVVYSSNVTSSREKIEWKGASAGMYFVTIQEEGYSEVKRLVIE